MKHFICLCSVILSAAVSGAYAQTPGSWQKSVVSGQNCDPVNVQIYYPKKYNPETSLTLVLLHSWGKSPAEWQKSSSAAKLADESNIVLVCPETGKTVYENEFYDDTSVKWNSMPGGKWMSSVFVPWLAADKKLYRGRQYTGIAGLEIGARGALLSAARNPGTFGFAGGLSGFYDSGSVTRSQIFTGAYGKYKDNKDRWENADSILPLAPALSRTTMFFSSGSRERNPSIDQTQFVLIIISQQKKKSGGFDFRFVEKSWGEAWGIWNPCLAEMCRDFVQSSTVKKDK
jgi:S-formylglutathione hydrolase FrmB